MDLMPILIADNFLTFIQLVPVLQYQLICFFQSSTWQAGVSFRTEAHDDLQSKPRHQEHLAVIDRKMLVSLIRMRHTVEEVRTWIARCLSWKMLATLRFPPAYG